MEHSIVYFEGKKIHYQDEGRGNVLVLLHGFLNNLDVWASYIYSYMKEMRVIAIDLPGHGLSDTYDKIHTMEFMADAVKAVLDNVGVEQCVILGHSMGGYVTLAFAEKYPYMLKGFGLLHSQALMDSDSIKENRYRTCEMVKANKASYIVGFIPELFSKENRDLFARDIKDLQDLALDTTIEGIVAAQKGMAMRPSRIHVLSSAQMPIMFIFGKEDSRIPLEIGLSQAMVPQYSETLMLGNVGHMAHIEAREYVKMRVYNFVKSCNIL